MHHAADDKRKKLAARWLPRAPFMTVMPKRTDAPPCFASSLLLRIIRVRKRRRARAARPALGRSLA
jgi:hypothetical protein